MPPRTASLSGTARRVLAERPSQSGSYRRCARDPPELRVLREAAIEPPHIGLDLLERPTDDEGGEGARGGNADLVPSAVGERQPVADEGAVRLQRHVGGGVVAHGEGVGAVEGAGDRVQAAGSERLRQDFEELKLLIGTFGGLTSAEVRSRLEARSPRNP